jgi:hypothetical protein
MSAEQQWWHTDAMWAAIGEERQRRAWAPRESSPLSAERETEAVERVRRVHAAFAARHPSPRTRLLALRHERTVCDMLDVAANAAHHARACHPPQHGTTRARGRCRARNAKVGAATRRADRHHRQLYAQQGVMVWQRAMHCAVRPFHEGTHTGHVRTPSEKKTHTNPK